jgi:hypothetical protein
MDSDDRDDTVGSVIVVEAESPRIEQAPVETIPSAAKQWQGDYDRCLDMLVNDQSAWQAFMDMWKTIADAKSLVDLDALAKESKVLFSTFGKDIQAKIKGFSGDRRKELTETAKS